MHARLSVWKPGWNLRWKGCVTLTLYVGVFSTDGVGFPVPKEASIPGSVNKNWVVSEVYKHPAMIGFGPGIEQNTHKIGECLDERELQHCAAFLARFPSVFAGA